MNIPYISNRRVNVKVNGNAIIRFSGMQLLTFDEEVQYPMYKVLREYSEPVCGWVWPKAQRLTDDKMKIPLVWGRVKEQYVHMLKRVARDAGPDGWAEVLYAIDEFHYRLRARWRKDGELWFLQVSLVETTYVGHYGKIDSVDLPEIRVDDIFDLPDEIRLWALLVALPHIECLPPP